mmetsp:Transcript_106420/g.298036  ORF Transcript_106420/g.298036 Transcript_106420/m.298036 type:complete len:238 (-) Transcript_106420:71-784(-)
MPPTRVVIFERSSKRVREPSPRPEKMCWMDSILVFRSSAAFARISRRRTSTFSRSCSVLPWASARPRAIAVSRSNWDCSPMVLRFSSSSCMAFFFLVSSWRKNCWCCKANCWSMCFCWSSIFLWYNSLSNFALYSAVLRSCSFWCVIVFLLSSPSWALRCRSACALANCCDSISAWNCFCLLCSASFVSSKALPAFGDVSSSFRALAPRSRAEESNLPMMASSFLPDMSRATRANQR